MEWLNNALAEFSRLDEGVRNATYGALGVLFGSLLSRFRKKPERVVVSVNAPPGEKVFVQLGDDDEEKGR